MISTTRDTSIVVRSVRLKRGGKWQKNGRKWQKNGEHFVHSEQNEHHVGAEGQQGHDHLLENCGNGIPDGSGDEPTAMEMYLTAWARVQANISMASGEPKLQKLRNG